MSNEIIESVMATFTTKIVDEVMNRIDSQLHRFKVELSEELQRKASAMPSFPSLSEMLDNPINHHTLKGEVKDLIDDNDMLERQIESVLVSPKGERILKDCLEDIIEQEVKYRFNDFVDTLRITTED